MEAQERFFLRSDRNRNNMARKEEHVHKFKRLKYKSGNTIFHCVLPDCVKKMNIALALGKRSICWRRGEPFILNEYSLRLSKPHCENCHKPKNDKEDPPLRHTIEIYSGASDTTLGLSERLKKLTSGNSNTLGLTDTIEPTTEIEQEKDG